MNSIVCEYDLTEGKQLIRVCFVLEIQLFDSGFNREEWE